MVDDTLAEGLRDLVASLDARAAERFVPPHAEPVRFSLVEGPDHFRITVTTDNGGGPETCHPVEYGLEIHARFGEGPRSAAVPQAPGLSTAIGFELRFDDGRDPLVLDDLPELFEALADWCGGYLPDDLPWAGG